MNLYVTYFDGELFLERVEAFKSASLTPSQIFTCLYDPNNGHIRYSDIINSPDNSLRFSDASSIRVSGIQIITVL